MPGHPTMIEDMETRIREQALAAEEHLLSEGWTHLASGRERRVFSHPERTDMVAKVPTSPEGFASCLREADLSEGEGKRGFIPIAYCRLDDEHMILWMERVEVHAGDRSSLPGWTMSVDCAQVGYDRSGTLVAYDL